MCEMFSSMKGTVYYVNVFQQNIDLYKVNISFAYKSL